MFKGTNCKTRPYARVSQCTVEAVRGMFGLCYLNKKKIGCITGESRANPASIPAWIYTAHYQMWGITSQEHTHLAPGLHTHTQTHFQMSAHTVQFVRLERQPQRRVKIHTATPTREPKHKNRPTIQVIRPAVRDSLKTDESHTHTDITTRTSKCFFRPVWRHASSCVPSLNITSLWCLGSEHWSLLVAAAYLFAFMQI